MKNLTKIFMAVAVALFAFSCVQDATDDLGVKVEGQGVKELTLSLEESRTHLGDKVVNEDGTSLYPLYWSEGDAISVNGEVSLPLAGVAADATSATFQFYKEVARPLSIVYPASAAVVAEEGEATEPTEPTTPAPITAYSVNFLAEQPYTVGTFAPQAAPMYGYAAELAEGEEETPVQLNHLTGVIRLALKGNGEKVTSIKVKAEKGAIAGPFTVDCTNGALTAQEGASNTVTVTFAEPLVLGAEATPIYLTVPAGKYGTFVITVNTEAHQKMTVKFSSDVKPINAGAVREFSEFEYAANNADVDEGDFIIDGKDALIEFARIASTFYPRTKAVVTADIDMTGYDWKPIEGFGAFEFDGGNFAIKGLNAPLFGTTAAAIKNVKLTDVAIVETAEVKVGAIARVLHGSMENCSAAGTLEMNNTTFAGEIKNTYGDICVGGLIGSASGATVTNSTNDVDITITSFCASTLACKAAAGGVIGGVRAASSVSNVINNGDITYASTTQSNNMYISGVVGKEDDGSVPAFIVFSDCTNNGSITATKESTTNGTDLVLSGVTGTLRLPEGTIAKNLVNTGDLTAAGSYKNIRISGLTSYTNNTVMESCSNSGDITVEGTASATNKGTPFLHGLFGASTTSPSITKCNNSGNITVKSGFTSTADSNFYMSGLAYSVTGGMQFTDNHNTGNLKIEGTDTEFKRLVYVSGLVDNVSGAGTTIDKCTNKGKIDIGAFTNATAGNNGRLYVGGLFRNVASGSVITNCKVLKDATIYVAPKSIATEIMMAAFVSYLSGSTEIAFTDCSNEADMTLAAEYAHGVYMGALFGQVYSKDTTFFLTFTRCNKIGRAHV